MITLSCMTKYIYVLSNKILKLCNGIFRYGAGTTPWGNPNPRDYPVGIRLGTRYVMIVHSSY